MTIDTLKNTVASFLPIGTKIRRTKHIDANNAIIDGLYYSEWGIPKPYLGSVLPDGWVWCNTLGQTVNASDCNPEFVTRMGSSYGGDGINTIGIPYIPAGSSLIQAGLAGDLSTLLVSIEVGDTGGQTGHVLTSAEMPIHNHPNGVADDNGSFFVYGRTTTGMPGSATNTLVGENNPLTYQGLTGNTGGSAGTTQAHNNMSPYFGVNFILRYK